MAKKVLITPRSFSQGGEAAYAPLRAAGFELIENTTGRTLSVEEMASACADIDGVIVGIDPMPRRVLEAAANLKAISKYGAGLDNIDLNAAEEKGIQVLSAVGANARSVAELAIALMFALCRHIPAAVGQTRAGGWGRVRGIELMGRTAGIVGLGSIGRQCAKMCGGLSMRVLGYDPFVAPDAPFLKELNIELVGLDELMRNSDVVSLHLPLTEQTAGMINDRTIASMKDGALLINTARGELVDEAALLGALQTAKLAGAAQDVFSMEPPPPDHPLLALDNFLLTPHIGAFTAEATVRMAEISAHNLVRMLA